MSWVKNRINEPSTWAGLALLLEAVGRWLSGDKSAALQGVFGAGAILMGEKSGA